MSLLGVKKKVNAGKWSIWPEIHKVVPVHNRKYFIRSFLTKKFLLGPSPQNLYFIRSFLTKNPNVIMVLYYCFYVVSFVGCVESYFLGAKLYIESTIWENDQKFRMLILTSAIKILIVCQLVELELFLVLIYEEW